MKYRVVLEPQANGGYPFFVPTPPGSVSQGETTGGAIANIREATDIYLEILLERGLPLPEVQEQEVAEALRPLEGLWTP